MSDVIDPLLYTEIAKYRLVRLLGVGGMGRVYLGVHPAIGSRVAIKLLAEEHAQSEQLVQRFFEEARTVNLIEHENIVSILDLDRLPGGRPYIVMEYVKGSTLRSLVRRGPLPVAGVMRIAVDVLRALDAVHRAGVIHRDLKPDNVMVTSSGRAKVLDFGIAKLARERPRTPDSPRTRTGALVGTPDYMAPEQIRGAAVDARTDLYALGAVLYEAATGSHLFPADSDFEVMERHLRVPPPDPRERRPYLPAPLAAVILQALAKSPAERFQSARAMEMALRSVKVEEHDSWLALASTTWRPEDVQAEVDAARIAQTEGMPVPLTLPPSIVVEPPPPPDAVSVLSLAPPIAPVRSSRLPWLAVPIAIALASAVTYAMTRPPSEPASYAESLPAPPIAPGATLWGAPTQVVPTRPALQPVPTTADPRTWGDMPREFAVDFDPKRVDPSGYLANATRHARALMPDATLRSVSWLGIADGGFIDVSVMAKMAVYRFQSPQPGDQTERCEVRVLLAYGRLLISVEEAQCTSRALAPRCTAAELHSRLQEQGMPRELEIDISLQNDPKRTHEEYAAITKQWRDHPGRLIANDCK